MRSDQPDPYVALCLAAERKGWKVRVALEPGDPPREPSRLSTLSVVDRRRELVARAPIRKSNLARAALVILDHVEGKSAA